MQRQLYNTAVELQGPQQFQNNNNNQTLPMIVGGATHNLSEKRQSKEHALSALKKRREMLDEEETRMRNSFDLSLPINTLKVQKEKQKIGVAISDYYTWSDNFVLANQSSYTYQWIYANPPATNYMSGRINVTGSIGVGTLMQNDRLIVVVTPNVIPVAPGVNPFTRLEYPNNTQILIDDNFQLLQPSLGAAAVNSYSKTYDLPAVQGSNGTYMYFILLSDTTNSVTMNISVYMEAENNTLLERYLKRKREPQFIPFLAILGMAAQVVLPGLISTVGEVLLATINNLMLEYLPVKVQVRLGAGASATGMIYIADPNTPVSTGSMYDATAVTLIDCFTMSGPITGTSIVQSFEKVYSNVVIPAGKQMLMNWITEGVVGNAVIDAAIKPVYQLQNTSLNADDYMTSEITDECRKETGERKGKTYCIHTSGPDHERKFYAHMLGSEPKNTRDMVWAESKRQSMEWAESGTTENHAQGYSVALQRNHNQMMHASNGNTDWKALANCTVMRSNMDNDPESYISTVEEPNSGCFTFEREEDASLDYRKQVIDPHQSIGALGPIRLMQHFGDFENVKTVEDIKRESLAQQTAIAEARKKGKVSFLEQVEVLSTIITEPVHVSTSVEEKDKDYAAYIQSTIAEDNCYNRYAILLTLDDTWAEEVEFDELGETKDEDELLNTDKHPSRLFAKKTLKSSCLTEMSLATENASKLKTAQLCQNAATHEKLSKERVSKRRGESEIPNRVKNDYSDNDNPLVTGEGKFAGNQELKSFCKNRALLLKRVVTKYSNPNAMMNYIREKVPDIEWVRLLIHYAEQQNPEEWEDSIPAMYCWCYVHGKFDNGSRLIAYLHLHMKLNTLLAEDAFEKWFACFFGKEYKKTKTEVFDRYFTVYPSIQVPQHTNDSWEHTAASAHNQTVHAANGNSTEQVEIANTMEEIKQRKTFRQLVDSEESGTYANPVHLSGRFQGQITTVSRAFSSAAYGSMFDGTFLNGDNTQGARFQIPAPEDMMQPRNVRTGAGGTLANSAQSLRWGFINEVFRMNSRELVDTDMAMAVKALFNQGTIKRDQITAFGFKTDNSANIARTQVNTGDDFSGLFLRWILYMFSLNWGTATQGKPLAGEAGKHDSSILVTPVNPVFGYNNGTNVFGENLGGAVAPVFPFQTAVKSFALHVTLATVPLNEQNNVIAIHPSLCVNNESVNAGQLIALLLMGWVDYPAGFHNVIMNTTTPGGANAGLQCFILNSSAVFLSGLPVVHFLLPRIGAGVDDQNLMQMAAATSVSVMTGPTASGALNANAPIGISAVGNLQAVNIAQFLYTHLATPATTLSSQSIWRLMDQVCELFGARSDLNLAWELACILVNRYSGMAWFGATTVPVEWPAGSAAQARQKYFNGMKLLTVAAGYPTPPTKVGDFTIGRLSPMLWTKVSMGLSVLKAQTCDADFGFLSSLYLWQYSQYITRNYATTMQVLYTSLGWSVGLWRTAISGNCLLPKVRDLAKSFWTRYDDGILQSDNGPALDRLYSGLTGCRTAKDSHGNSLLSYMNYPSSTAISGVVLTTGQEQTWCTPRIIIDFWLQTSCTSLPKAMSQFLTSSKKMTGMTFKDSSMIPIAGGLITAPRHYAGSFYYFGTQAIPMTVDEELWNFRILWHALGGDLTELDGVGVTPTTGDYVCQKFIYQDGFMASAAVNGAIYACDSCWVATVDSLAQSIFSAVVVAAQNTMSQIVTGRQFTGLQCLMINNVTAEPLLINDDGTVGVSIFKARAKKTKQEGAPPVEEDSKKALLV